MSGNVLNSYLGEVASRFCNVYVSVKGSCSCIEKVLVVHVKIRGGGSMLWVQADFRSLCCTTKSQPPSKCHILWMFIYRSVT